ncbi:MAG TPA: S-layer protein [Oceanithermus profundus]|uniref:S-layer protein n=1 Tax=Oceanithermus profundus TaxID=187137 RepID=A0A7C4ZI33_9DEIN|nr:S-layer protein [Oceanithermus profundus]
MKKAVLLLAGLLTVLSMGFASAQFSDVPAGHWAKEAVEKIAAEGLILGFPDGTFRGNENLTRYQAAMIFYRLLQKLEPGQLASMDSETITALRNAVQELAAELASLGVRVSALEDNAATKSDVARLEKMIAELKGMPAGEGPSGAALKDLADRVEAAAIAADTALAQVQALEGKVDAVSAQASANADSIKALNELAVLLNQDVLSLQDRVTNLEKASGLTDLSGIATKDDVQSVRDYVTAIRGDLVNVSNKVSALEANVSDLQDKVGPLVRNAFTISGSLTLQYRTVNASGFAGYDVDRLFDSAFSTGDANDNGQVVDESEGLSNKVGQTDATLKLKIQSGALDGTSKGEGVNTHAGAFQFSITGKWKDPADTLNPGAFSDDGIADSFSLVVDEVSTTFTIAEGQSLSFTFGQSVNTKFTEYVFDNEKRSFGHGIVGTFKPGFLGAEIKAVYGNSTPIVDPDETVAAADYFYGVRASVSPFDGFTLGGSYLKQDSLTNDVFGGDLSAKLGPLSLMGEYFSDGAGVASYYAKGDVEFGAFKLGANYRNIGAITSASMMSNDVNGATEQFIGKSKKNSAPFRASSNGFGANLSAELGIFSISGYFDSYTLAAPNTDVGSWQAYGGELGLKLAGMTLTGMYKEHSNAGSDTVEGAAPGQDYEAVMGASLDHPAEGAIVPGLHAYAGYMIYPHTSTTDIEAYADYTNKFSIVNLTVLARYHSNSAGPTQTTKFGGKFATDPLGIVLAPSLKGGYVMRSTTGGISETYWFAGMAFNKFLFAHSVLEAGIANYQGANVNMAVGMKDKAFDAATDYIYDDASAAMSGYVRGWYVSWKYWDLNFDYANYTDNASNTAQAFQIKYTVTF